MSERQRTTLDHQRSLGVSRTLRASHEDLPNRGHLSARIDRAMQPLPPIQRLGRSQVDSGKRPWPGRFISVPQFPLLESGNTNGAHLPGLLQGSILNRMHSAKCLAPWKHRFIVIISAGTFSPRGKDNAFFSMVPLTPSHSLGWVSQMHIWAPHRTRPLNVL